VDALVCPGSHHEPNERMAGHLVQRVRVIDRTSRVVVPARDLEHRRFDSRDLCRDSVRTPVRVERRMRDPSIPERYTTTAELLRQVAQREVREGRPDIEVADILERA